MNLTTEENWLHFMFPNSVFISLQTYREKPCQETVALAEASAKMGIGVFFHFRVLIWYHLRKEALGSF